MIMTPVEQIVITPIAEFGEGKPLFVANGDSLKASPEQVATISNSPSLHIEDLCATPRKRNAELGILTNSIFSPSDSEIIRNSRKALLGELKHVKLYRIIIREYNMFFEFYNSRSGLLSSLQPNFNATIEFRGQHLVLQPIRDPFSFTVECGSNIYYVCYKWSRRELRMVTSVKVRAEGEFFRRKQPMYTEEICEY